MGSGLSTLDLVIVALYAVGLISLAFWVSREKPGHEKNTEDYFLAGKSLPWWAIGASLIAANISAEQIIGMSGSGFVVGLGIASYEWMAAITLLIVGKFFLPIFLEKNIYTMPQFLEQRYDHRVRIILAVFWLGVYVFVNLTAVLWLGALAINTIAGLDLIWGLLLLGSFSLAYSLYGGLKAVAMTDIIQVVLLVFGGFLIAYLSLTQLGEGEGFIRGFVRLTEEAPDKFDMILSDNNPNYMSLPGLSVLLGGMWVMNLSYWGFNQYIIQRTLAAKDIHEARKGIAFAAYLKLLMPIIVVLPGIAAVILVPDLSAPDQAYPEMMALVPHGIRGLVFAALIAAIVSSLGSMANSVSTIFTMDLYKGWRPESSQQHLVKVGRTVSIAAMGLAVLCAKPLLGNFDQAFQYIQEFTGFFTPGICAIFILGMFWRDMTVVGALFAAIGSAVLSLLLKLLWPEVPFMDRVGMVFVFCVLGAIVMSYLDAGDKPSENAIDLSQVQFKSSRGYKVATGGCVAILCALYATWW